MKRRMMALTAATMMALSMLAGPAFASHSLDGCPEGTRPSVALFYPNADLNDDDVICLVLAAAAGGEVIWIDNNVPA